MIWLMDSPETPISLNLGSTFRVMKLYPPGLYLDRSSCTAEPYLAWAPNGHGRA